MTLPLNENSDANCQCTNKNCVDCKCGCGPGCCSKDPKDQECPFIKAHPNWQKCTFMGKMFMTLCPKSSPKDPIAASDTPDTAAQIYHSACDSSKCSNLPTTECTSCHKTPAFNHTVTLSMDTDVATDQTEDIVFLCGTMTCWIKQPAPCRIPAGSCNCCTCNPDLIQPCPSGHHHHHSNHTEVCSCVHPVMICACCTCAATMEDDARSCHHGHAINTKSPINTSIQAENPST